nr:MAG TPA: hypothetical protein [Caudoviricetes sp.]
MSLKSHGQTREYPCVPKNSLGTWTNPKMSLRNRSTMRFIDYRDKPENLGTKPGTEFYLYS